MADRDGKCCLVTQPLAFWDLWLHPQLRPTLSSRKEAGASPTLSAHPAASYSTCILHVTMLVVVPAHRGPGLLWSCNKSTKPKIWAPLLNAGSEQSLWVLTRKSTCNGDPQILLLLFCLWTSLDKHNFSSMNSYIQAIPLWLLYKWKVWELPCKINIQKVHTNDTWGTYKINK